MAVLSDPKRLPLALRPRMINHFDGDGMRAREGGQMGGKIGDLDWVRARDSLVWLGDVGAPEPFNLDPGQPHEQLPVLSGLAGFQGGSRKGFTSGASVTTRSGMEWHPVATEETEVTWTKADGTGVMKGLGRKVAKGIMAPLTFGGHYGMH